MYIHRYLGVENAQNGVFDGRNELYFHPIASRMACSVAYMLCHLVISWRFTVHLVPCE